MTQREIQENLIRTVRDMLLTSCEKMGAQSIEHCWTRHDGTEVKLALSIHPAGEKEEKPEDELYTYARAAVQKFGMNKQVDMAIEEMSELTKALLKHRRASDCATTVKSGDNIREEMEDVRIMLWPSSTASMAVVLSGPKRSWPTSRSWSRARKVMEMSEHFKIDCNLVEDRKALVVVLSMNGYTVRMGKEKRSGKSTLTYFVEYWRADDE